MNYPHMNDTQFPNVSNVNVYQYQNDFDYSRWGEVNMRITLCRVPWDVGSVKVGNRELAGVGNVAKFASDDARNAWFDKLTDVYKFETKYKDFHQDEIRLPVPFEVANRYNYVMVEYTEATPGSPIMYMGDNGVFRWFYFIRDTKSLAPNMTLAILKRDSWTTFINSVHINGMVLERGHYPVSMSDVDEYLDNPIDNNDYLLAEDVNFGVATNVRKQTAEVLNDGTPYAVFITTALISGNWGTKVGNDWRTPGNGSPINQGVITPNAYAIEATELDRFLEDIDEHVPQFKPTVQGVFFATDKTIDIGTGYELAGHTVYRVNAAQKRYELIDFKADDFKFPDRYKDLAKLYTYPYSHVEISDEYGRTTEIHVEDTGGVIALRSKLSIAYPWIRVNAHVEGVGSRNSNMYTFQNVSKQTFNAGGDWYDRLIEWNVPLFAVYQDNGKTNDYSTHYDREQSKTAYGNEYDNMTASASATYNDVVDASNTAVTNQGVANAASKANVSTTNAHNSQIKSNNNLKLASDVSADTAYSNSCLLADIDAVAQSAQINNAATIAGAAVGVVSNAAMGAATGALAGPAGIAAGGIIGAVSSIAGAGISVASTNASAAVSISKSISVQSASYTQAHSKLYTAESTNTSNQSEINSQATTVNNRSCTAALTQATNSANTSKSNAARDRDTMVANAGRNRDTAQSAISNQKKQAAITAPNSYGTSADGETATCRPMAVFTTIKTQSRSAIRQAGDYFKRYGYAYNGFVEFDTFNVMSKFSYWKCSDIWLVNNQIPDAILDEIRFYLMGGVCVWNCEDNDPDIIQAVSIYDNEVR